MKEKPHIPGVPESQVEAIREELNKILSSAGFQSSERRRRFLQYTVEETIRGRGDAIKEYSIGTEVLDRDPSFDPRLDTIVRTEARRLRERLAKYYETDGKEDALRIEFRKGSYAPLFRVPTAEDTPVAEIAEMPPSSSEPAAPELPRRETPRESGSDPHRFNWLLATSLTIASCVGAGWMVHSERGYADPTGVNASVVVLPFVNISSDRSDRNQDYLSDGLTSELIDSLTRVPGLHVVARTSAFQYKGKTFDVRKIGRDLNVRNVLEGTLRKSGNRLLITAELDNSANGYTVWSQRYDEDLKDAPAIQHRIAQSIISALGVRLSGDGASREFTAAGARRMPVSAEAHQAYLKGRFFWNKLDSKDVEKAIGYFQQALAIEPDYAEAYAGLAHCYTVLPVFANTPPPAAIPQIRDAALKALALDPSIGEAHIALAAAYDFDFDWANGEKEFRRALELTPGDAVAHRLYGAHLLTVGRMSEALAEDKIGLDLDPISPFMAQGLGRSLYFSRRYGDAIAEYRDALMLDPGFRLARWDLGRTYLTTKMYAKGMSEMMRQPGDSDDASAAAHLAYAFAVTGKRAEAEKIAENLAQSNTAAPPLSAIARIYIGLGEQDRAFEWLDKCVRQKRAYLYLKADPVYDPLRSDPRFTDLLRRMRLL